MYNNNKYKCGWLDKYEYWPVYNGSIYYNPNVCIASKNLPKNKCTTNKHAYEIDIYLAGYNKNDVKITQKNRNITVSVNSYDDSSFTICSEYDLSNISITMKDGLLKIIVPAYQEKVLQIL